ncbi:uncharacterized protein LOC121790618 [Salvia splendens]|uniref:uncharacterized protein LOC121790618 n=1 Tax=Salvia splendens TaxID=180675 RepID=UPI001C279B9D|nr:uncharacterized protein LOC121790618 [Salvia splendens]
MNVSGKMEYKVRRNEPAVKGPITFDANNTIIISPVNFHAQNWRYAAKQFVKAYPDDVLVHSNLDEHDQSRRRGVVAGLEPVNFITFAMPHLGSRGHKQVPVFCGVYTMERLATRASFLLGRTGRHLFLSDSDDGKSPILLRMSSDSEDLKFMSLYLSALALQSFKRRAAYANARFDNIVGWSSSSLRRLSELPKCRSLERNAKYPHIVNEEKANFVISPQGEVPLEIKAARGRTKDMEETMIRGLTRLNWERVDVSFTGSMQWLLAHSTIQVKTQGINSEGADVIQHMIDNFVL